MTVDLSSDPQGDTPKHFIAKMEYEGQVRYFVLKTLAAINECDVLTSGEPVISMYLSGQQPLPLLGPVPPANDESYLTAVAAMETGGDD